MLVKYAVIASDKLMEVWTLSVHLCAERDGDRKKGNKIWPFAQKNNNCSSVRVTLRCGLLFASSVRAGQSQWAVREALQMTMWHVGVMERFSKAWDSSTLPLMVPAAWISALIIICTGTTKMTLFSLGGGGGAWCVLVFYFSLPRHSKVIRRRHKPVCLTFCLPVGCTEGLLFFEFANHPNIYTRNHNCTAWEGKHPAFFFPLWWARSWV